MINVIGNGYNFITGGKGSLSQFSRYQFTITENGMSMQIYHL
jgi:hypothetical protein